MNPSPNVEPVLLTGEPMPVVRLFSDRSLALTFDGQGMHFNPRQAAALMLAVLNEFEPIECEDVVIAGGANDHQVGGEHYRNKSIQPWDALAAWMTLQEYSAYCRGTAIAYLARCNDKGGLTDIKKARHYLDKLIEVIEAAERTTTTTETA